MEKEIEELGRLVAETTPEIIGTLSREELAAKSKAGKPVKAVLFVPEGTSIDSDFQIEVVGLNSVALSAMVARRC